MVSATFSALVVLSTFTPAEGDEASHARLYFLHSIDLFGSKNFGVDLDQFVTKNYDTVA